MGLVAGFRRCGLKQDHTHGGNAFSMPDGPEAFGGRGLDIDHPLIHGHAVSHPDRHPVFVRRYAGRLGKHGGIHVDQRQSGCGYPAVYLRQQMDAVYIEVLGIRIGETVANVPHPRRTQKRIASGMYQDIGV